MSYSVNGDPGFRGKHVTTILEIKDMPQASQYKYHLNIKHTFKQVNQILTRKAYGSDAIDHNAQHSKIRVYN